MDNLNTTIDLKQAVIEGYGLLIFQIPYDRNHSQGGFIVIDPIEGENGFYHIASTIQEIVEVAFHYVVALPSPNFS